MPKGIKKQGTLDVNAARINALSHGLSAICAGFSPLEVAMATSLVNSYFFNQVRTAPTKAPIIRARRKKWTRSPLVTQSEEPREDTPVVVKKRGRPAKTETLN